MICNVQKKHKFRSFVDTNNYVIECSECHETMLSFFSLQLSGGTVILRSDIGYFKKQI